MSVRRMPEHVWTCQRRVSGVKCGAKNPRRRQLCLVCGGRRRPTQKPKHTAALDMTYEECVRVFGEQCGICGAGPRTRRLHRDHEHKGSGVVRGLLCFPCNVALRTYMTVEWLLAAAAYLQRAKGFTDGQAHVE